ncbi:hypothetical protein PF007_g19481 [Phytophthora fragariae]|uniref:Uncharacterized protein n=1 Tax=Phytophthora fragariae TaxID=53985 RepID=A0A6A3R5W4_9STRA|nr:hypothetical protein PF007_g19481 [Phytophthora fragariae]
MTCVKLSTNFAEVSTECIALFAIAGSNSVRLRWLAPRAPFATFSEGDYVLWSRVDKRLQGNKLLVRWVGPFQVTKALPHSFLIRHLLTGVEYDVHGSRLKFYHDADLDETAAIREQCVPSRHYSRSSRHCIAPVQRYVWGAGATRGLAWPAG